MINSPEKLRHQGEIHYAAVEIFWINWNIFYTKDRSYIDAIVSYLKRVKPITIYTIRTGSYPQIIHAPSVNTGIGTITSTEFIDANGRRYTDWIPAIWLE